MERFEYRLLSRIHGDDEAAVFRAARGADAVAIELFALAHTDLTYARSRAKTAGLLEAVRDGCLVHDLELGLVQGALAVVREAVDGITLRVVLQRMRTKDVVLQPHQTLGVLLKLLDCVQRAHQVGGVHGNIDSGNVWLSRDGQVRLTDFAGHAPVHGASPYRAPEVSGGDSPSPRADIYSLAALAYELLTLHRPENSTHAHFKTRHDTGTPPPSRVGHRVDARLDPLILRALQHEPEARFRTSADLAAALREFLLASGGAPSQEELGQFVATVIPNEATLTEGPVPFIEQFELDPLPEEGATAPAHPDAEPEEVSWEAPPAESVALPRPAKPARAGFRIRTAEVFEVARPTPAAATDEAPEPDAAPAPTEPNPADPSAPLTCPGCTARMQRVFVEKVGLARCPSCLGMWLGADGLQALRGRPVPVDSQSGQTDRRCAYCHTTLEAALLPGDIPVESCRSCGGFYLDKGQLEQLIGRPATAYGPSGFRAQPAGGFVCVKCGKRFELKDANVISSGLACRECTPQVQTTAAERARANHDLTFTNVTGKIDLRRWDSLAWLVIDSLSRLT